MPDILFFPTVGYGTACRKCKCLITPGQKKYFLMGICEDCYKEIYPNYIKDINGAMRINRLGDLWKVKEE